MATLPQITGGLDYYKLTMAQVQWRNHPDADVTFEFKNRNAAKADGKLLDYVSAAELQRSLERYADGFNSIETGRLAALQLPDGSGPVFAPEFLDYLLSHSLPPVTVGVHDDDLAVSCSGPWPLVTFWETVVMSETNDIYFRNFIRAHDIDLDALHAEGDRRLDEKISFLQAHPEIKIAEFGTRRRFGADWQRHIVERLQRECPANLIGTSNVLLAGDLGLAPIGSYAHEMDMVYAGLADGAGTSIPAAHLNMMADWRATYGDNLSIALTDTFTSRFFFDSFSPEEAARWQGLRHDSGDPFEFGEKAITWYSEHGIDPATKLLLFSDGLDLPTIAALQERFEQRAKVAYGWGTNLTNDLGLKALNIVMKATEVDGTPTVKLSDVAGKHTGSPEKVHQYEEIFGLRPLLSDLEQAAKKQRLGAPSPILPLADPLSAAVRP